MSAPDSESSQRENLLSSSVLFLLALLPNHLGRFGILVWASVSILRDIASRFSPTGSMKILLSLIATTIEVLAHAQATCLYQIIPLVDCRRRLAEYVMPVLNLLSLTHTSLERRNTRLSSDASSLCSLDSPGAGISLARIPSGKASRNASRRSRISTTLFKFALFYA